MVSESIVVLLTSFEILYDLFLLIGDSKIGGGSKKNSAVFRGFFTLFPYFNPYSIRGLCNRGKSWRLIACDSAQNTPSTTCADGASYKEKAIFERMI